MGVTGCVILHLASLAQQDFIHVVVSSSRQFLLIAVWYLIV